MFETLGYWMNYVLKIKDPLNKWNVILIYYFMEFSNFQFFYYLKRIFKHLKVIILKNDTLYVL